MTGPRLPLEGVVYADAETAARYFAQGAWIDRRIDDQLRARGASNADVPAFICDDDVLTFGELDRRADALADGLLQSGLKVNDRALFQMGTTLDTVMAFFGCLKAGVIPVCSIPQYRELEIDQLATLTRPSAYFVQSDGGSFDLVGFAKHMARRKSIPRVFVAGDRGEPDTISMSKLSNSGDRTRRAVPTGSEDVAVLQLSGGSTGIPKIIPRFHAEYMGHVRLWCDRYRMRTGDVGIWALPLMHNAGMMFALLRTVIYGCTTVLMPRWDPARFFSLIEQWRVNHGFTIGPHAPAIAAFQDIGKFDLSSLRFFFTLQGASAIERATGVRATNMFGITEGLVLTSTLDDPPSLRHGTVGAPCSDFDEVRLLRPDSEDEVGPGEVGELCFRGPSSLRGYFAAPELSAECLTSSGFFRSADMVRRVELDGRVAYAFEGRTRDNINRGGEKFGTEDIERLIALHPDIADGKVVAMPDPVYGEKACAFLIQKPGRPLPSVEGLGLFLLEQGLAKFKLPERIEPIDAFPTTRVGKLDRAALRTVIADRLGDKKVKL
ncbi:AMP-binding protein [Bradyrhizobium liaoningense]|uniref:AMP-binding protein n=1 Tax=Bradyrhizobium liaoningense TaxID=43992 RepID=UPI001BA4805A|nr:AMP-binding protein [Bradyrhizobium liaoningense]MBR0859102.1 AMP-binding protein [Bradyrhizobium liaoningense]